MEYVMARSLLRDWEDAKLNEQSIIDEIEELTHKQFSQIFGMMVYLALILKETRNISLWSKLLSKGGIWQNVVFETFRKLPDEQLDAGVYIVLQEILSADDKNLRTKALDILKLKRVGKKAPGSIVDIVCK